MTSLALSPQPAHAHEPTTVEDLGLEEGLVRDLALKLLYYAGRMTRNDLGDAMRLSPPVVDEIMQSLSQDSLAAIMGGVTGGPTGYLYALSQKGLERAEQALSRSGYVGPAPVPLKAYVEQAVEQTVRAAAVTRDQIEDALGGLVLAETTMRRIGRAAASRKPTLVHGNSGNGKTSVATAIAKVVDGTIRIPYALEIHGHIVHLYDPSKHVRVEDEQDPTSEHTLLKSRSDGRWVSIQRPMIWAGGELTKQSLELVYDDQTKVYEAPLPLKANGGTLIIDDFGRQQIPAVQLLNRWIVALEGGIDHLTMHTGQTIEVPFDVLVLFSTNLSPAELADEAFLRRIRYKVEVPNPSEVEFRAIFRRECEMRGIAHDDASVTHLLDTWYEPVGRELRGCHPRDVVEAVVDACEYEERRPALSRELLDEVCATYFL
ncbi:MAG: ATP-binding protein [Dehalococcoidia bacterium]